MLEILAKQYFPKMLKSLISNCLSQIIPQSVMDLNGYDTVYFQCKKFQNFLQLHSLVDQDYNNAIVEYVVDLERHFWRKKRCETLEKARSMLVTKTYDIYDPENSIFKSSHPAQEMTSSSFFELYPCRISANGAGIVSLLYDVLEECRKFSEVVSKTSTIIHEKDDSADIVSDAERQLIKTSRDIISLFQAICPIYHQQRFINFPQLAILFSNDCKYISFHLSRISCMYRHCFIAAAANQATTRFNSPIPSPSNQITGRKDSIGFYSEISQLMKLADSHFRDVINSQYQNIRTELQQFNKFEKLLHVSVIAKSTQDCIKLTKVVFQNLQSLSRVTKVCISICLCIII